MRILLAIFFSVGLCGFARAATYTFEASSFGGPIAGMTPFLGEFGGFELNVPDEIVASGHAFQSFSSDYIFPQPITGGTSAGEPSGVGIFSPLLADLEFGASGDITQGFLDVSGVESEDIFHGIGGAYSQTHSGSSTAFSVAIPRTPARLRVGSCCSLEPSRSRSRHRGYCSPQRCLWAARFGHFAILRLGCPRDGRDGLQCRGLGQPAAGRPAPVPPPSSAGPPCRPAASNPRRGRRAPASGHSPSSAGQPPRFRTAGLRARAAAGPGSRPSGRSRRGSGPRGGTPASPRAGDVWRSPADAPGQGGVRRLAEQEGNIPQ
jgi:hypothetical protein